jgi:hypothetical protein
MLGVVATPTVEAGTQQPFEAVIQRRREVA